MLRRRFAGHKNDSMQKLQMVDLKRQYEHIKPEVDAAIQRVIDSAAFIGGEDVKLFAGELASYLNVKHVIPCGNGTDALQMALMALDLQPGDEVITPSFTFIATVEVIALLKLKPVFVDVDADTYTLNVDAVKNAITSKTKAIVPVHLYGQTANMEALQEVADEHNIAIIEDTAQAIGGNYTYSDGRSIKSGTAGLIGCTSFFPSKNLGCYGDGGAVFTNDDSIADRLRMIANHGMKKRYYHEVVGCNSRLDSLQAAVLRIKLPKLDEYCAARIAAASYYDNAFANHPNITVPHRADYCYHVFHQYTLQLKNVDRNEVQKQLAERDIPSMIYYPVPCHKQEMFKEFGGNEYDLPTTDMLTQCVISLPIHTELTNEELNYISTNFIEVVEQLRK